MYRGITFTPAIYKLFESVLTSACSFCTVISCSLDLKLTVAAMMFTLMESAKHFNKRDSKLFCAFLDAIKAFDKVLINGLIYKLIKRNVPVHFIRCCFIGSTICTVQLCG